MSPRRLLGNSIVSHQPYALSHILPQPHQHLTAVSVSSGPKCAKWQSAQSLAMRGFHQRRKEKPITIGIPSSTDTARHTLNPSVAGKMRCWRLVAVISNGTPYARRSRLEGFAPSAAAPSLSRQCKTSKNIFIQLRCRFKTASPSEFAILVVEESWMIAWYYIALSCGILCYSIVYVCITGACCRRRVFD